MINWKLRLQNKTTLISIVTIIISIIYSILDLVGVVPKFEQEAVVKIALTVIDLLALLGITVDPTTKGIADSERAMSYTKPNDGSMIVGEAEVDVSNVGEDEDENDDDEMCDEDDEDEDY